MELSQVRAFLAVAEELHFRRAAERLHMAQPPLTRAIQQLEKDLGGRLFDRSTRSVRLTAAGAALVEPARRVLESVRDAEAAVHAARLGESGRVRVVYAGLSTYPLIARWARQVRQHRPGIHLDLSSQNFGQPAMDKLLDGETDVALGRWDLVPAGVAVRVVLPDSLVVAMPDSHRLAGQQSVAFAELADEEFVSLPPYEGAVLSDRLRQLSHAAGFAARVVQVAPDSHSAFALVGAEVGCHLTVASAADNAHQQQVSFVPVSDETLPVHLQLAWRQDDESPALRAVLALLGTLE